MTGDTTIAILVLTAYVTLLLELVVFPVPSEASTYQLFFEEADPTETGASVARARGRSWLGKALCYLLPTALGVALFLVPLLAVFLPSVIDYLWPLPALRAAPVAWSGGILVVLGRSLTFASVLQLRGRHEQDALFADFGLFRYSRNPGLVGMYVFYLGNSLLFPCAVLFAGFVPYVLNMHQRVRMEEGQLSKRLGDVYVQYLRRVPRYLPLGPGLPLGAGR